MKRAFLVCVVIVCSIGFLSYMSPTIFGQSTSSSVTPQQPKADIVVHGTKHVTTVQAGDTVRTPCFSVVVPFATEEADVGCRLILYPAPKTPGAAPDSAYFSIETLANQSLPADASLDAKAQMVLDGIASVPHQTLWLHEQTRGLEGGKYDLPQGPYEGMKDTIALGRPAKQMTWGFTRTAPNITACVTDNAGKTTCSHTVEAEYVNIVIGSPKSHIVWDGVPIDSIFIHGYTKGYQPDGFKFALTHAKLN